MVFSVASTHCHSGCRGMTSPGLVLRRCGSSSSSASLEGQLCGCSQRRRLTGERRVARLLGQRQGLTTDDDRCGRLTGISLEGLFLNLFFGAPMLRCPVESSP